MHLLSEDSMKPKALGGIVEAPSSPGGIAIEEVVNGIADSIIRQLLICRVHICTCVAEVKCKAPTERHTSHTNSRWWKPRSGN